MPLIYRAMTVDGDGKPKVGQAARTLGARVPPAGKPDIRPDGAGIVRPRTGGMSVAPGWRNLPAHRIPKRLKPLMPDAAGKDEDACFCMGDGPFVSGAVATDLELRVDRPEHGMVEPAAAMPASDYQRALAVTRDQWVIDEG